MSWLGRLFAAIRTSQEPPVSVQQKILIDGNLSIIPYMYSEMINGSDLFISTYIKVLAPVVNALSFSQLLKLDTLMRQNNELNLIIGYKRSNPQSLILGKMSVDEKITILGLGSFHPSGYVREWSIRQLAEYSSFQAIRYIALRLNDWVSVISSYSRQFILNAIDKTEIDDLVKLLPYLFRLNETTRVDNKDVIDKCYTILLDDKNIENLKSAVNCDDYLIKKICYTIMLRGSTIDLAFLTNRLTIETNQFIKALILRGLIQRVSASELKCWLVGLLTSKSVIIRLLVMDRIFEMSPSDSFELLVDMLLDMNAAVRERARYYILKLKAMDFRQFYLDEITNNASAPSIAGLGETGKAGDAEKIYGYIDSPYTDIVRAAMKSLMMLDRAEYTGMIVWKLEHNQFSIANHAFKLLKGVDCSTFEADIYYIYTRNASVHVKRCCAKLLVGLHKWASLKYCIELIAQNDEWLQEFGQSNLNKWQQMYNRSFIAPTQKEIDNINAVIALYCARLPIEVVKNLRFLINSYGF